MRRSIIALLVFQCACSDNKPVSTPGDSARTGDTLVGGDTMVGDSMVGDSMVGDTMVGDSMVGDSMVGDSMAGDTMVGDTMVGDSMVGDTMVGDTMVGDPGLPVIDVIITEFRPVVSGETEFVEIYNRGSAAVDIGDWTLNGADIDHPDNPGGAIIVAAGTYSYGLGAPGVMPVGVTWAYNIADLSDDGDTLVLADGDGNVIDTVDFTSIHTDPNTVIAAHAFPAVVDVSTQLDVSATDGDNDDGALWCVTFRAGDTAGSANQSCSDFVINEVLYDWIHPDLGSGDANRVFVELAGPGGGSLAGIRLSGIAGAGSVGQDQPPIVNFADNQRMPVDGLLVVADGESDGSTWVPGADIVLASGDPQNGPDAIKLRNADTGATIDIVGYGSTIAGDNTFETTPVGDIAPIEIAIAIARDAQSRDTDNNAADFHFDPTPTPGAPNDAVVPMVVGYAPNNGIVGAPPPTLHFTTRDITNIHSIDGNMVDALMAVTLAGVDASSCGIITALDDGRGDAILSCGPGDGTVPVRGDIVITNPPALGGSAVVTNGWTYTGVNNETGSVAEADWCNLQWPTTTTAAAGSTTGLIYGQVYETGVTDLAGAPDSVVAELGYGPAGHDPTVTGTWVWTPADWNSQMGDNDEFMAQMIVAADLPSGTYWYTFRYSFDDGLTHTYGDTDGAGSADGFQFESNRMGTLTVP